MRRTWNLNLNELFPDNVSFLKEVQDDFQKIDGSIVAQIIKAIKRVASNPKPSTEGGYGVPLKNDNYSRLAGYNKIKFKKIGIRVIYRYEKINNKDGMKIVIISCREDNEVYIEADKRIKKYKL